MFAEIKNVNQLIDESVGRQLLLYIAAGDANWYNSSGEEFGYTWKNYKCAYLSTQHSGF